MLPDPEKPKQDETIPSQVTVEPAGEFAQPNIPPDLSRFVTHVPTIPPVPTGVSGVEPAKEAVPPVPLPPSAIKDLAMVAKGPVTSSGTWDALRKRKSEEQKGKVA